MRRRDKRVSAALVLAAALLSVSSCANKGNLLKTFGLREELTPVRSSLSIADAEAEDSKKLMETFADSGWEKDDDGKFKKDDKGRFIPNRKSLYTGEEFDRGSEYGKREARLKNREVEREVYRTPEYLERQSYDKKDAREGGFTARESNFDNFRAGESGAKARESGSEAGFLAKLNPFRKKTAARESGRTFRTPTNSRLIRLRENVAVPNPAAIPRDGDFNKAALTMDDVKKLLHPEAFD